MKQKNIIITGGSGFIGKEAAKVARDKGHNVAILDMKEPKSLEGVLFEKTNIASRNSVFRAFGKLMSKMGKISAVQHYAALFNYEMPYHALRAVNVEGTGNIAEACSAYAVHNLIYMGAVAEYEEGNTEIIRETTPSAPCEFYGKTKQEAGELLWKNNKRLGVTEFRAVMVYGPEQPGSYIDAFFEMIKNAKGPIMQPKHNTIDSYVHTHDIARAALHAIENDLSQRDAKVRSDIVYNLGDDDPMGIHDVTKLAMELIPSKHKRFLLKVPKKIIDLAAPVIEAVEGMTKERTSLPKGVAMHTGFAHHLDNSKLKNTGFEYEYKSIRQGFPEVIKWYQDNAWG